MKRTRKRTGNERVLPERRMVASKAAPANLGAGTTTSMLMKIVLRLEASIEDRIEALDWLCKKGVVADVRSASSRGKLFAWLKGAISRKAASSEDQKDLICALIGALGPAVTPFPEIRTFYINQILKDVTQSSRIRATAASWLSDVEEDLPAILQALIFCVESEHSDSYLVRSCICALKLRRDLAVVVRVVKPLCNSEDEHVSKAARELYPDNSG